jgi:hypothetical protein
VGLGELPFEGRAIATFQDDLDDRRDAFMKSVVQAAMRIGERCGDTDRVVRVAEKLQ